MATFESLQERLAALQETTGQLRELIDRLAHITFQPGSVPLSASDEDNVAAELSAEISQILREEDEDLELLQEEITDLRAGRPGSEAEHRKTRLKEGAQRLAAELKHCRTSFRKAQLSARRSLEAAQKLERELLLASYAASAASSTAAASPSSSTVLTKDDNALPTSEHAATSNSGAAPSSSGGDPPPRQEPDPRNQLFTPRDRRRHQQQRSHAKKKNGQAPDPDADVVQASDDVTLALRRTHALIAGELAKSAFAARTLAESSAALAELQGSYEGIAGLLARSRELAGALVAAHKSDTWYLRAALRLLLATLAWLVFRRFLYGPLWWLVWLPVRTGWRVVVSSSSSSSPSSNSIGSRSGVVGTTSSSSSSLPPSSHGLSASSHPAGKIGGDGEAVPTVRVGRGRTVDEGDTDSMVEKVGRIVEDTLNRREEEEDGGKEGGRNRTGEDGERLEDEPNPTKRVWEEQREQAAREAEQVRDEL